MAIELITGRAGTPHVDSSDMRALYAEIVGGARYLLNDHGTGVAEMESANDCHLMPAELLVDGAHVRITGAGETVHIDNGSSSYDRVDVVALHYTSTGNPDSRVESISVEVVKGTPVDTGGESQDPAMPSGSATILDGSTDVYIPYVRIKLVGLVPQTPESMLPTVPMSLYEAGTAVWPVANGGTGAATVDGALTALGLKTLKDSSPYVRAQASGMRLYTHSVVVSVVKSECVLLSDTQIRQIIHRSFNVETDCAVVMNGDQRNWGGTMVCTVYDIESKSINLRCKDFGTSNNDVNGILRINIVIATR